MERPFDFPYTIKQQAFFRQWTLCAHCGLNLVNVEDHAHHVVPSQSGLAENPADAWIQGVDNCVILCYQCHFRVHGNGKTANGLVAAPSYFPYSHGSTISDHLLWVNKMNKLFYK